ncbi:crotonase/enoyl-CoA hydratase family protein [Thalassotalea litorea]|uniref:Crotonase/enoyl-CoA hydratase family protein n=1 Tax=Thalassotalea litorea TaxID=2020715 RepID=A0A5R9INR2_9GAMM|nr:crotonase/enoyl-CoA hydratase family protein [Thalassotalea litorea]TLU67160.1 crotonase/enoyl-CoA hydratase family protein [Thalassotalea litorea]
MSKSINEPAGVAEQQKQAQPSLRHPVDLTIRQGIAYVTLNRPEKLNALDLPTFQSLANISRTLRKNKTIRGVILQGAGTDFCSGLDIKSMMKDKSAMVRLLKKWLPCSANLAQQVSSNWRKVPVPVIAVIQGRCWGGGLQIALGADFRYVSADATLAVMESKWGLIPDMAGNMVLREILPKDQALRLAMTAEPIDAKQALQMHLVTQVSDRPLHDAENLLATLTTKSPDALAAIKRLYTRNWQSPDWKMLMMETWYQLKIITGKNQSLAVKKQLEPDNAKPYQPRKRW